MRVVKITGAFVLESRYEERAAPKAAGWRWHGNGCSGRCLGCRHRVPAKVWYATEESKVVDLVVEHGKAGRPGGDVGFADPDLEARAKAGADGRSTAIVASRAEDVPDLEVPCPDGIAYLPYQRAGISYAIAAMQRGCGVLFADDMGLGKTVQAAGVINADPTIEQVLVVCPASLRSNWRRELERWLVRPARMYVVEDGFTPPGWANIIVVNFDRLVGKHGQSMLAALLARQYDLLIVDEAHVLANQKSQRAVAVLGQKARPQKEVQQKDGLTHRSKRLACLTGTPILNRPIDVYPLLNALDPATFGDFFKFAKRFCDARQEWVTSRKKIWNFDGASNLPQLQELMRSRCMVRRLKKDVLPDLPPKRRQLVVLEPEDARVRALVERELAENDQAHDAEADLLEAQADVAHAGGDLESYDQAVAKLQSRMSRLRDTAGLEMDGQEQARHLARLRHDVAVAKTPYALEHIDAMLEEGIDKIVVWAHHHDVIDLLMARYQELAVKIDGRSAPAGRQATVDAFQQDPAIKIFVGQILAAGVGLTLTAACHSVFIEIEWTPAWNTQAEDREHRIGQQNSVLVQHLVFEHSMDLRMVELCLEKQQKADKALDAMTAARILADPLRPQAPRQPPRPDRYPVATEEERRTAAVAMQIVAGVCDGASARDGLGFSGADAFTGHRLAGIVRPYTDGEVWLAKRLARRYRRQLPADVVELLLVGGDAPTTRHVALGGHPAATTATMD